MHVRSIVPTELNQFVAVGPHSLGPEGFAQYIRELWERGTSQPERCFIVEDNGQMIGRIVYRGQGSDINTTGLYLPWEGDYLTPGSLLFQDSFRRLQQDGVKSVEALVTSAWPYQEQAQALMTHIGITLIQTKVRYVWQQPETPSSQPSRLVYRTLSDIGEEAYTDIIRRASVGTLDRLDELQIQSLGAEEHARGYFNLLKNDFEHFPNWWVAAYTDTGELVGHVEGIPYNLHRHEGAIGYIGVVPEQRGKGYINDLLNQASVVMSQDGITTIIGDTDEPNMPMRKAFVRCGYTETDTSWVYHGHLDQMNL